MRILIFNLFLLIFTVSCMNEPNLAEQQKVEDLGQYITILGVAQDAGYPQINCQKVCCNKVYSGNAQRRMVSSLGLVDHKTQQKWLFDATPDMPEQLQLLGTFDFSNNKVIDGVFLTHAHMGHYTGLMYFGREAMSARSVPVYAMPRMGNFLKSNGPWNQLIALENIEIKELIADKTVYVNERLKITPLLVPHRDEYSETVGYKIEGPKQSALFIPDIDKWDLWERSIIDEVKKVDYAFLDATFFKDGELSRPMSEVPHPFISETIDLFKNESMALKSKIYFIHFNHTNPALQSKHPLKIQVEEEGFNFAKQGDRFKL